MKDEKKSKQEENKERFPGKTKVEGQNPKQDDSTDQDLYHDESRKNEFDPEVAKSLKPTNK